MSWHFHPWRRLRDLGPTWRLHWSHDLAPDVYGQTDFAARTITLREGMSFEERRCTITHEVEHVLRGPVSTCDAVGEELEVDRRASRLLLPSMADVTDALAWNRGAFEQAAEDLWVDPWMLEVRLGSLYGLEQKYLRKRMRDAIFLADGE